MANFNPIWNATDEFEGGYQALASDEGNYCPSRGKVGSQLIGTKYGISAIGKANYDGGKCPTVAEMKNLNPTEARKIAKEQYWDVIKGDKINSQALAHLIFDIRFGGKTGTLQVRQAINAIKGKGTVQEYSSDKLTDTDIALINSLPEKQLFDKIIQIRKAWLVGHPFQTSLTNRINKIALMYTLQNVVIKTQRNLVPIVLFGCIFSIGLFLIIKQ